MRSVPATALSSLESIDRGDTGHLYQQLFVRIRRLVADGVLAPNSRLPSSRALSRRLAISRNSVATAFEMLIADGWLEARPGSGTYVAASPPVRTTPSVREASRAPRSADPIVPFAVGPTAVDLFPIAEWRKIQARRWAAMSREALLDHDPSGWNGLREAICAHVAITRGIACTPEQVFVNSGARMSIDLSIRALGLLGAETWLENPGFHATDGHLLSLIRPVGVPVDENGIDVEAGIATAPGAAAAIVTPSGHFPTGAPLSPPRRQALLAWAQGAGAWVLEDDYDVEFAFEGRPLPPLYSASTAGSVIYVGTFNKVMFPSLRLAYLIAPEHAIDRFAAAAIQLGEYPNLPNQMVLADFIQSGGVDRHLARCRAAYAERRAVMLGADLGPGVSILPHRTGLHVLITVEGKRSRQVDAVCRQAGIRVVGVHRFRIDGADDARIMLGFSGFDPNRLRTALARLRAVLASTD